MNTCTVDGCGRATRYRLYCSMHQLRMRKHGTTDAPMPAQKNTCRVEDCESEVRAKDLCNKHYKRWRTYGDVNHKGQGGSPARDLRERFVEKYVEGGVSECWTWTGTLSTHGYGVIHDYVNGVMVQIKAHRLAYELSRGHLDEGDLICHTCDNRRCVNPNHLYAGSIQDNNWDRWHGGPAPRPNPELLRAG